MAQGFSGKAASRYFKAVGDAAAVGSNVLEKQPAQVESGEGGAYRTGVDSSANIVVDSNIYNNVTAKLIQTDSLMEEKLQGITTQIEEMCSKVFVVPETTAKIQTTLEAVKSTMAEFRDLTTQVTQITKMYVSQMEANDR